MNTYSNRVPSFTAVLAAPMLTLVLTGCGGESPIDARATEPSKASSQPSALDPALDNLGGVTHHG